MRTLTATLVALLALSGAASAAPAPGAFREDDPGGFHDILPPGTNGLVGGPALLAYETAGTRPAHNDDQLSMYADLVRATPGLKAEDLEKYYKDSSFGVPAGHVERTYSPRDDVTIVRDSDFGVPHIYGATRAGAMFGIGYATGEDRLFFIDVLRHLGRAQLTSFAGGAAGNRAFDEMQWATAPYTEKDLGDQIQIGLKAYGALGAQVQADAENYLAGLNAYIADAKLNPNKMPGEYPAIGRPQGPDNFTQADIIATASLVGGIFGKGGGRELVEMQLLQAFNEKFGNRRGRRLWREWAAFEDPDAPTTIRKKIFRYQRPVRKPPRDAEALADPGTFKPVDIVESGTSSHDTRRTRSRPPHALPGLLPQSMLTMKNSNALIVGADHTQSGHPIAVFGPQVAYFAPEILMEQDVHAPASDAGPAIEARGAAFPGVNLYVELGRGRDYAWSATSAGQDLIDTFAVPLCGDDKHYMFRGQCLEMERLERTNSWVPNAADQTPPGTETLVAYRTKLGIVTGYGSIKSQPVAYVQLRSTYFHEVDSAGGFSAFNDPEQMKTPQDFQRAASLIGYTFNWFYVDDKHFAYFNSGNNPLRPRGITGQLPTPAKYEWKGYDPDTWTARYTSFARHPRIVDGQPFITSWNNKQARGYAGADSNLFSSVYRSQLLDRQIRSRLGGGHKVALPEVVDAMEEAGTTDLRAQEDLPLALRILGTPKDPALADAVAKLRAWVAAGFQRRDRDNDKVYEHSDAIRILDAWWPLWLRAEFEPRLGKPLFDQLAAAYTFSNDPNNHGDHLGSAWQDGWYGYVFKDLGTLLRKKFKSRYALRYCGNGSRARCRAVLEASLTEAIAKPATEVYPGDTSCAAGDQWCWDSVRFRPLGAVTQPLIPWINRPTYQQALEIQGHR
jgi:acyl-homoserine lactone acylase PvdQ